MGEQRRDVRYPARIVARVVRRNQAVEYLTNDVSFRGAFVRTDSPPALRQLVKLELVLPDGVVVSGHAMVVHMTERAPGQPKGEGPVPGVGFQFWGPVDNSRAWESFVHGLRQRQNDGTAAAKATDRVRRASERFKLVLEVVLDGTTLMTRDVSENGMAIRTDLPLPIGTRASLRLRAGEVTMDLDVVVRREINEPNFRGLGVEIVELEPAPRRAAFVSFVQQNAPSDEDSVFIAPGDPKLH